MAKGLDADAVPCPRGRRWAMTSMREMVFRDLYRGRIVYGKTTWDLLSKARASPESPDMQNATTPPETY